MAQPILLTKEQIDEIFGRFAALSLDTSGIRRKFIDCPYGAERRQALDIYLPNDGSGPFPAVLFLHGGGWAAGNKKDAQILPFIGGVERGFAVVSVGYRLVPDIRYPENLYDVNAALRWLHDNAESYLIDPDRIALCGASAGAHLAMMAAFTQGQPAFDGVADAPTCTIRAVVEQYGPSDFLKQHQHYDASGYARMHAPNTENWTFIDRLIGLRLSDFSNLTPFINPIANVHPDIPAVLLQHGRYDPVVPYQQATELYEKIITVCGKERAALDISDTYTHADPGFADADSVERIFSFLSQHLK